MATMYTLRLYHDELPAKAALALTAANRVCYLVAGAATIRSGGQAATLGTNSAWHASGAATLVAGSEGATLARFELVRTGTPAERAPQLEAALALDAPEGYLMRCDKVSFPLGGIAYTHTHQGGGIRRLLAGGIRIETGGKSHDIASGGAWFESGPEPVLALASNESLTSFVRVMILPRALQGKSSIRYVKPEDQDKPKLQQYQMFVDDFIVI